MSQNRLAQLRADAAAAGWGHYIRSAQDEQALLDGCYIDERMGEHVCRFFRQCLRHHKGRWAGKPFELADVQRDHIIMPLFAWMRADGTRRYRSADIWVAKKNFKSTMCAGMGLYMLFADGEPGSEVYAVANDREQAGVVYGIAADMVDASPLLSRALTVRRSSKRILNGTSSWFRALSGDHRGPEGLNAHCVIVDEIHVFDERGRQRFESLRYGGAGRLQPMSIVISTAGDSTYGIGYERYERSKQIASDMFIDPYAFVYIAEAPMEDDPGDPETWRKANPMMGITISEEEMRDRWREAQYSPREMRSFRRYRLNQWVESVGTWLAPDDWAECPPMDRKLDGCKCYGGLDLAFKSDLTAWVLVFPRDDGTIDVLPRFWLPREGIELREKQDAMPYRDWADQGFLMLTEGNVTDYQAIESQIVADSRQYELVDFAFDRYAATHLTQRLQDSHGLRPIEMPQTYPYMSEPAKALEQLVKSRKLRHGNHPVLSVQAGQVQIRENEHAMIRPVKRHGTRWYRIDGIVATVMALARHLHHDSGQGSVYERDDCVMFI